MPDVPFQAHHYRVARSETHFPPLPTRKRICKTAAEQCQTPAEKSPFHWQLHLQLTGSHRPTPQCAIWVLLLPQRVLRLMAATPLNQVLTPQHSQHPATESSSTCAPSLQPLSHSSCLIDRTRRFLH
jgi:hypothetical protein